MKTLLLSTTNKGKIREIKEFLKDLPLEIKDLEDVGFEGEIAETGSTFRENALQKARAVGDKTGFPVLAEDSGIEVDALGGKPGIYSARYAPGSDMDRVLKLLGEMLDVPIEKRGARYISVFALYDPKTGECRYFEGEAHGKIIYKPVGTGGFGYDPVFFSDDLGMTFAQASMAGKNKVSHRGRALQKLKTYLLSK